MKMKPLAKMVAVFVCLAAWVPAGLLAAEIGENDFNTLPAGSEQLVWSCHTGVESFCAVDLCETAGGTAGVTTIIMVHTVNKDGTILSAMGTVILDGGNAEVIRSFCVASVGSIVVHCEKDEGGCKFSAPVVAFPVVDQSKPISTVPKATTRRPSRSISDL